jgi:hypothetical protein
MTVLPQEVLDAVERSEEPVSFHNWLYSFVPATKSKPVWQDNRWVSDGSLAAFLTGYCKLCNSVFSVEIPVSDVGAYRQITVPVAKIGCVPYSPK